jgi:hypothetical protein
VRSTYQALETQYPHPTPIRSHTALHSRRRRRTTTIAKVASVAWDRQNRHANTRHPYPAPWTPGPAQYAPRCGCACQRLRSPRPELHARTTDRTRTFRPAAPRVNVQVQEAVTPRLDAARMRQAHRVCHTACNSDCEHAVLNGRCSGRGELQPYENYAARTADPTGGDGRAATHALRLAYASTAVLRYRLPDRRLRAECIEPQRHREPASASASASASARASAPYDMRARTRDERLITLRGAGCVCTTSASAATRIGERRASARAKAHGGDALVVYDGTAARGGRASCGRAKRHGRAQRGRRADARRATQAREVLAAVPRRGRAAGGGDRDHARASKHGP